VLVGSSLGLLIAVVVAFVGFLLSFFLETLQDHASVGLCFAHCSNLNL